MPEHSPTPWRIGGWDFNTDGLVDAEGKPIRSCYGRSTQRNRANIALMRAAPELLRACRGVIALIETGPPRDIELTIKRILMAVITEALNTKTVGLLIPRRAL